MSGLIPCIPIFRGGLLKRCKKCVCVCVCVCVCLSLSLWACDIIKIAMLPHFNIYGGYMRKGDHG